ncbi:MAG: molybdopterin cofactor-binding domain-containing protein [Myxococcota bacterium]
MTDDLHLSRRTFLTASGAAMTGGLVLTYQLGSRRPMVVPPVVAMNPEPSGPPGTLNPYIHIRPDDTIILTISEVEMGQGIATALAQILADELRARWMQITVVGAPVDAGRFGDQITEASSSVRTGYEPLRQMAASARQMLVRAAALQWGVPVPQCEALEGQVHHRATRRSLTFGALAAAASRQQPPVDPLLLPTDAQNLVGRSIRRIDATEQLRGTLVYGLDVRIPGMKFAQVARGPQMGSAAEQWDDGAALSVPGVTAVQRLDTGVAVIADHTWAAEAGRRALNVIWRSPDGPATDDRLIRRRLEAGLGQGQTLIQTGDAAVIVPSAKSAIRADYRVPFLAHAAMEPLSCTAHVRGDGCDIWVGTQAPARVAEVAAEVTGLSLDQIVVHPVAIGGSFGRRRHTDFVVEALKLSQALSRPVQAVWSRADDIGGGYYRPAAVHRLAGGLDEDGWPLWWSHDIAAAASEHRASASELADPYLIAHRRLRFAQVSVPVTAGAWRSGVHSHLAFARECFLDELAVAGDKDPVALRRRLLAEEPRFLRVLEAVARIAGYGDPLPEGRAHGVALHACYGTAVAQVAEVSVERGRVAVHKIFCAIDCGRAVNPDGVRAQIEGSVAFALSAALYGRIGLRAAKVQQSNFHDYRLLRLRDMPDVTVELVSSTSALGGVGEPGVPPVAPAVSNALFRLTGQPVHQLPLGSAFRRR